MTKKQTPKQQTRINKGQREKLKKIRKTASQGGYGKKKK